MARRSTDNGDGTFTLPIHAFNTNTNTYIGNVANAIITLPAGSDPSASGGNGDISFDSAGNLYYTTPYKLTTDTAINRGMLYQVDGPIPSTMAIPTPTLTSGRAVSTFNGITPPNGVAFSSDGNLILNSTPASAGPNTETVVNPRTGALISQSDLNFGNRRWGDLASCDLTGSISATTKFDNNGRASVTDNFQVTLTPPAGAGQVLQAQTSATQPQASTTEALATPAGVYTLTQTRLDSGTNIYNTVYQCVDTLHNNTQVANGIGTTISYQFPNPADNHAIECTFVNSSAPSATPFQDSGNSVQGVPRTVVPNIRSNDFADGAGATDSNSTITLGTDPSTVAATTAGISVNPTTGAVNTSATTPAGTYTLTYQLCLQSAPTVCNTTTISVVVAPPGSAEVNPQPDSGTTPAGTAATPIANVRVNDTVNGQPATATNSTITVGTDNATQAAVAQGVVLDPATGSVTTTAQTPAGTYALTYTLCDSANPTVCQVTTATVTVTPVVSPQPDSGTTPAGTAATPIANVRVNDTVNGQPATATNSTLRVVTPAANPGVVLDPATGQVTTTAAVPPGTYTITYELCDSANPTVCQVTTATVTVTPAVGPQPDSGTTPAGTAATPIANVRVNDTVNGQPATATNSTLRVVTPAANPGVVLDPATGQVTTTAAVPPGTYTITYELCDSANPTVCQVTTATVTVTPAVSPQPDSGTTPAGTAATPIANVRVNDTVNGQPATATNSTLRVVTPAANPGVVLDPATGQVTTTAAVPPGTYTITYELCDRLTPATCVNNTATVTVTPAVGPQPDSGTTPAGTAATPIANVRVNDTVNGQPATATNSTITVGTDSATQAAAAQGVVLDPATGSVTTTARTPAGTYTLTYTLCDTASPAVCQVTTVTVIVTTPGGNGITSVPTLSEYGLLILAAMMGLLGWQQSRRRQRM